MKLTSILERKTVMMIQIHLRSVTRWHRQMSEAVTKKAIKGTRHQTAPQRRTKTKARKKVMTRLLRNKALQKKVILVKKLQRMLLSSFRVLGA